MKFKDSEIGFLSALFDVRGGIKIIIPQDTNIAASVYVWITDKNFKLMEFIQKFDAVIGRRADGQFKAKWKDRNAYNVLKLMLPHLIIKQEQAEVGIEFYDNKAKNTNPKEYVLPLKLRLRLLKDESPEE